MRTLLSSATTSVYGSCTITALLRLARICFGMMLPTTASWVLPSRPLHGSIQPTSALEQRNAAEWGRHRDGLRRRERGRRLDVVPWFHTRQTHDALAGAGLHDGRHQQVLAQHELLLVGVQRLLERELEPHRPHHRHAAHARLVERLYEDRHRKG